MFITKGKLKNLIQKSVEEATVETRKGKEKDTLARRKISPELLWRLYEQDPYTRAMVEAIAKAAIAKGWEIRPTTEDSNLEEKEILEEFFNTCNPQESFDDILEDIFRDEHIFGNSYVEIVEEDGKPSRLWMLDATMMEIKFDEHGIIQEYKQGNNNVFTPEEVLHFKLGTRGSSPYGLSPIETLASEIETDLYAGIYNKKFFENGAKLKMIIKMKGAGHDVVERNRAYMEQMASPENSHKDLIMEGDYETEKIGVSPKDAFILELRKFIRDERLAVFGIPPAELSIIETGNIGGGTGTTQERSFNEKTIKPRQRKVESRINKQIVRDGFGIEGWEFKFKEISVKDRLEESKIYQVLLEYGVLEPEEVRTELGYEPLEKKNLGEDEEDEDGEKSIQ